jgi:hypothetical protein
MQSMNQWVGVGRFAAWCVATAMSAGLVWLGLSPVLRTAVPERVDTGSPADLQRSVQEGLGAGPKPSPTGRSPSAAPSTAPPARTPSPPRSPSARPSPATAAAPSPSIVDGWTVLTEQDGSTSYLRHFDTDGGETTIRMTPGLVSLVSATPDPGYAMETLQPGPDRVVVRFYAAGELFTVDAIWWQNAPYAEVTRTE